MLKLLCGYCHKLFTPKAKGEHTHTCCAKCLEYGHIKKELGGGNSSGK
jgi:hypothetical protein